MFIDVRCNGREYYELIQQLEDENIPYDVNVTIMRHKYQTKKGGKIGWTSCKTMFYKVSFNYSKKLI